MANNQIPNFHNHQKIQNQKNNQTGINFGIQNLLKPSLSSGPTFSVPKSPTPSQFPATSSSSFPPASPRKIGSQSTAPMASNRKAPRGRHLIGERVVYDVDVRISGEAQPELEVTPITKYTSDATLIYGRQIAVNRSYIGYGLKPGSIRVLDMNTALRALLRGHTERVTDMAFFAEDVPLLASASVDGLIIIWKIVEGKDEEDKPQISEKIVLAIKIVGPTVPVHPRLCWHPHKQEILMVAIGNCILKIDTLRVGRGKKNPPQTFILCAIDKLIGGVTLVGKHDGEITDLSMCQWMMTRLASASLDGVVKIWADGKAAPISVIRPHDGLAVNSVTFLTSPHQPDHIVLLTAGPLNTEVKLWTSTSEEGWLLPSEAESWQCTETLEIVSSAQLKLEDAFFNQIVVLPRVGMVLLANAKKNAIYAVHIEYGQNPAATRMDYISEFSVAMPILSLSGTSVCIPDGSHVIQINCVQTQAIQQYALRLSQCLPPPIENVELEKSKPATSNTVQESFSYSASHLEKTSSDTTSSIEVSSPLMNPTSDDPRKNDKDVTRYETPSVPKPAATAFKNPAHLITPAELLSTTVLTSDRSSSDTKIQDAVTDNDTATIPIVAENIRNKGTATNANDEDESRGGEPQAVAQKKERVFNSQACGVNFRTFDIAREMAKDVSAKADDSEGLLRTSDQASKGQKQKGKNSQPSAPSSSSPSPINFTGSSNEPDHGCSDISLADSTLSQLSDMNSKLDQLVGGQQELQKQICELVSIPITKEIRRLEGSLSQNIEKIVKANLDALWARFQEENAKQAKAEAKVEEDRAHQFTNLVTNCVSRDLPAMLEKIVKKELASIGPVIARSMTQIMEKSISTAITESFQKGVGEKTVAQLEKSVSSKVESTLAKHIQSQFQTSGKQALQDALKTSLEASIIPAFEASCKNMFVQVDAAFQKGFVEHSSTAHQQFQSTHSSLAVALREAINSASTVTRTLSGELADGQRKLLALAAAGATSKSGTPLLSQLSNGSLADLAPVDPLKELSKLISERKFEESFTVALQKSDVSIVSWMCSQVDLQGMLLATPLPLSQGVLLALLQQLSCDINNDTQRKIGWMTEVAVAIDPADPSISVHVRMIFEQVYQVLSHHRNLPATSVSDANTIRLLMHVINSVVMSCK